MRPTINQYFIDIMNLVGTRATCDRGKSGCVITRENHILVSGYVGSPRGTEHCDDIGHLLRDTIDASGVKRAHCVRTVHAEQNAICQAAREGISLKDGTLYCKMTPCLTCAMMIINCGIKEVFCEYMYHDAEESEKLFNQVGIKINYKNLEVLKYDKQ